MLREPDASLDRFIGKDGKKDPPSNTEDGAPAERVVNGAHAILAKFIGKGGKKDPPSNTEDGAPAERRFLRRDNFIRKALIPHLH